MNLIVYKFKKLKENITNFSKGIIGLLLFYKSNKQNQIFLYHEISYRPSQFAHDYKLNVNPTTFENQIKWISKRYQILDPLDLLDTKSKIKRNTSRPKALITFDDGSISVLNNAAPILRKLRLKALFFLNMKPIEGGHFWVGKINYLLNNDYEFYKLMKKKYKYKKNIFLYITDDDLKNVNLEISGSSFDKKLKNYYGDFASKDLLMENSDVFIYGSHLYDHYNAANLNKDELKSQLDKNKLSLLKINGNPQFFAYPFGQPETCLNSSTNKIIISSGVKKVFYSSGESNLNFESEFLNRVTPSDYYYSGYMKYLISSQFLRNLKSFLFNILNKIFK